MTPCRPAVFFDRDNTLIVGVDYLGDPDLVELMPGAAGCIATLRQIGFAIIVVSNQSGVARRKFTEDDVRAVDGRVADMLLAEDSKAALDLQLYCPHHPKLTGDCDCRKPKPGMLLDARDRLRLNLATSWLVGDAPRDIAAGAAAGCRTILLDVPNIERSPAADEAMAVEPDERAASLQEVTELILRT
jgi:D-glycero-D-manno-heptose 1,7-bisphosphate phosphatase